MATTAFDFADPSTVFTGVTKSLLSSVAISLGDKLTSVLGTGSSRVVGGINGSISRSLGGGVMANILGSTIGNAAGGVLYGIAGTAVGTFSGTLNQAFSQTFSTVQKMAGITGVGFNIPNLINSTYTASGDLIARNLASSLVAAGITPGSAAGIGIEAGLSGMFNTSINFDPFSILNPSGIVLPQETILSTIDRLIGKGSLIFPADLGNYFICFEFGEYRKSNPTGKADVNTSSTRIFLPIPLNLADIYQLSWSEQQLGIVGAVTAIGADIKGEWNKGTDFSGSLIRTASAVGKGIGDLGVYAGRRDLSAAISKITGLNIGYTEQLSSALNLAFGTVPNPHLALLFNQPNFKTHQFIWKLSPNSQAESDIIRNIIKTFKVNASPAKKDTVFLKYPSVVFPTLATRVTDIDKGSTSNPAPYLYKFKPCVIESFSVNYNGAGIPSFHSSGAPAEVDIAITLKEIELWYREDMEQLDGIGVDDRSGEITPTKNIFQRSFGS